jgi:hypothetical protein
LKEEQCVSVSRRLFIKALHRSPFFQCHIIAKRMWRCEECYRAIHRALFSDGRDKMRVVLAFVRSERDKVQRQHTTIWSLLYRILPTGNVEDLYQTAKTELELRDRCRILQTAVNNSRLLLANWDNFISKTRTREVNQAFLSLWSLHDVIQIPQLTAWLKQQGGTKNFPVQAPYTQEFLRGDLPRYIADVLANSG